MGMPDLDAAAAALAAAEACRTRGDLAEGLAAAEQAERQAEQSGDEAQRDRAGWLRAFFTYRRSDFAGLLALGETLTARLRVRGGPDFGEYLRWMTLAACEMGRFDVALPAAYEVQALADAAGKAGERALALNAFGACFERMGDPWQAERLMREALDIVRVEGSAYERFITLNNLCAVLIGAHYLLRGAGVEADARAPLERALPLAREAAEIVDEIGQAHVRVHAQGNLGEVLLHLGEADESHRLLQAALAEAEASGVQAQGLRVRCSLAEWELRHGDPARARAGLQALLDGGGTTPMTALRVHHAMFRAARALGDPATALVHLERHAEMERRRSVTQLRAQSELFITRVEAEHARRDAERHRERAREMEAHAQRDPLTGLGNRREVARRLPRLLQEAAATEHPIALAMLDLDNFKQINDRFGHPVGDRVLVAAAQVLRDSVRATDLVARTGGEEFLAVLPDAPPGRAREVCERIRARIEGGDWAAIAPGLTVTISIGLAAAPPYDETALTARADAALYRAKSAGRNRVLVA